MKALAKEEISKKNSKNLFAERLILSTRQRPLLSSALFLALGKDPFAECHAPALGKVFFLFLASKFFVQPFKVLGTPR